MQYCAVQFMLYTSSVHLLGLPGPSLYVTHMHPQLLGSPPPGLPPHASLTPASLPPRARTHRTHAHTAHAHAHARPAPPPSAHHLRLQDLLPLAAYLNLTAASGANPTGSSSDSTGSTGSAGSEAGGEVSGGSAVVPASGTIILASSG